MSDTFDSRPSKRYVSSDYQSLGLSHKAAAILAYLHQNAGRIVDQDELLEAVWRGTHVQPESVKVHIYEIRRALGDNPKHPRYIQTVPKRGYRLLAPVRAANGTKRGLYSLVGRDAELAALEETLHAAVAGERQMILVSGEAGIGKTALVEAFAGSLPSRPDLLIATGRCMRIGGPQEAYYALLEALGRLDLDDLPDRLATHAPTWAVQFPGMFAPGERTRLLAETWFASPGRMLREICDLLECLSRSAPLILILEDIHWADGATNDFISAATRRTQPARLMIVCTSRDIGLTCKNGGPAISRELCANARCRHLELKPLDRTAVRGILSRGLGEDSVSDGLVDRMVVYTGGNPLFVCSVAQGLVESSGDVLKPNEDLHRFLYGQFLDMADEDRNLLECASVAGSTFTGHAMAPLLNTDSAAADALYEALATRCTWIRAAGSEPTPPSNAITLRFEFKHGLFRDIAYQHVELTRRRHIHRCWRKVPGNRPANGVQTRI